jgi:DNA-binding XRE family transcriptional regulator
LSVLAYGECTGPERTVRCVSKRQFILNANTVLARDRELQELSQNELPTRTGIPQSTFSAIENDRVNLGVERAKVLARAMPPQGGCPHI